jgi:hypothetical protein
MVGFWPFQDTKIRARSPESIPWHLVAIDHRTCGEELWQKPLAASVLKAYERNLIETLFFQVYIIYPIHKQYLCTILMDKWSYNF